MITGTFPWGVGLILTVWVGIMAMQWMGIEPDWLLMLIQWSQGQTEQCGDECAWWRLDHSIIAQAWAGQFFHVDGLHLLGNVAYFSIFGTQIERLWGPATLILVTFMLGILAFVLPMLWYGQADVMVIGASGAISGLLGMALLLKSQDRVGFWIPLGIVPQFVVVKTWWVILFWGVIQLIFLFNAPNYPNIAVGVHVAGFFSGVVLGFVGRAAGRNTRLSY